MKTLFRCLMCLVLAFLILTNPTTGAFTSWYVDETLADCPISIPERCEDAFAQYLEKDTECSNYVLCSIYTYGNSMTLGIGGRFFPLDDLNAQLEGLIGEYSDWTARYSR